MAPSVTALILEFLDGSFLFVPKRRRMAKHRRAKNDGRLPPMNFIFLPSDIFAIIVAFECHHGGWHLIPCENWHVTAWPNRRSL